MITLKNITKIYKAGSREIKALDNISLHFENHEFVSILGPSGCGKTTLLNIIGGLDKYNEGHLAINDEDTKTYRDKDWDIYRNQNVGFIFQSFNLISHLSVLKNVEMSLSLSGIKKHARKKRALDALDKVGLLQEAKKRPNQLSGGQMQRVSIARAIVNDPKIILADEPTGALDSETSGQIMDLLQEISKERLVIMVTHNKELAYSYSTRIIKLFDGKVMEDVGNYQDMNCQDMKCQDKNCQDKNCQDMNCQGMKCLYTSKPNTKKPKKKQKVNMSFFTALLLSLKNLISKWIRTTLTVLAGSIGIVGVGLVIAVSTGVQTYLDDVQARALGNYPIILQSRMVISSTNTNGGATTLYPDTDEIFISRNISTYEHVSAIDEGLVDYIEEIPSGMSSIITYNRQVNLNIIAKDEEGYRRISTSYFREMVDDSSFVSSQYDVLAGTLPSTENDIVLVIDRYNAVDEAIIESLNIDITGIDSLTFADLLDVSFKVIGNDDYYVKVGERYYTNSYQTMYEASTHELKICGIVRVKPNATQALYSSGILYSPRLTNAVVESARASAIAKEQLASGYTKSVFTGEEIVDVEEYGYVRTRAYQYERILATLGVTTNVTAINIYTSKFSDRLDVEQYVTSYEYYDELENFSYSDYMKTVSEELSTFIQILTKALIAFACISLVVSGIMIAIITYISVLERTKEIGILRSVGARKIDIARIFTAESVLIGFSSGIFGIILCFILASPINHLVVDIIANNTTLTYNLSELNVVVFSYHYLLLLLLGSVTITIIAGFIPSIIAAHKSPIDALRSTN